MFDLILENKKKIMQLTNIVIYSTDHEIHKHWIHANPHTRTLNIHYIHKGALHGLQKLYPYPTMDAGTYTLSIVYGLFVCY